MILIHGLVRRTCCLYADVRTGVCRSGLWRSRNRSSGWRDILCTPPFGAYVDQFSICYFQKWACWSCIEETNVPLASWHIYNRSTPLTKMDTGGELTLPDGCLLLQHQSNNQKWTETPVPQSRCNRIPILFHSYGKKDEGLLLSSSR